MRELPVKNMSSRSSSSCMAAVREVERRDLDAAVRTGTRSTYTPPNAAMYWSCLPTGRPSTSISMRHASSASSAAATCSRFHA